MSLVLALVLGLFGLLKWCTTIGAIWWLRTHGRSYRNELRQCSISDLTGHKIREILDRCEGRRVFPWGVLEYVLLERSWIWRCFGRWIYRLPTLPLLALISYVSVGFNANRPSQVAWTIVATVYQIAIILSAIEAIYSYIGIGGYRRYYQVGIRLSNAARPDLKDDMYELDVILPLGLSAVAINVLAFIVGQIAWHSFLSSQVALDPCQPGQLLLQGVYFVITSMSTVGYGDIVPHTLWGQMIAILIHVQSLALIIGLFATMISFGVRLTDSGEPQPKP